MFRKEPRIVAEKRDEGNNADNFAHHAAMEDLLEKLKLLNYEGDFLKSLKMKPIHRYYFVIPKNPGEQFYLFTALAAWLLRKSGQTTFDKPQESDDPNDVISNIVEAARKNGIRADFPANKLKQGVGEHVVTLLDQLANLALEHSNVAWKPVSISEEKEEEIEVFDDESEINLERVEEEMIAAYSDDSDDENLFHIDEIPVNERHKAPLNRINQNYFNTDEENWRLEVERVVPKLKVTLRNDNRDWRSHLDQMRQFKSSIDQTIPTAKSQLEKLHQKISFAVDKMVSREKYLNRELDATLVQYRQQLDELSKVKEQYTKISGGVAERNRELAKLNSTLETIKQQMEERGSSMTDGTPLVNIKKAITKVKQEIVDMNVRIGVLESILLQSRIRDEQQVEHAFSTFSVF